MTTTPTRVLLVDDHELVRLGLAELLGLAEKTVKNHASSLLRELGLRRRTQAAVLAVRAHDRDDAGSGGAAARR